MTSNNSNDTCNILLVFPIQIYYIVQIVLFPDPHVMLSSYLN